MPAAWRIGSLFLWALRLRRLNGPNATWPFVMFSGIIPERLLATYGRIYIGKSMTTKTRSELIANVASRYLRYFRSENGDLPPPAGPLEKSDSESRPLAWHSS